jgi:hypothetical protein
MRFNSDSWYEVFTRSNPPRQENDKLYDYRHIHQAVREDYHKSPIQEWDKYIKSLDLGVEVIKNHDYKIVDEKKWMLNKIKYGF